MQKQIKIELQVERLHYVYVACLSHELRALTAVVQTITDDRKVYVGAFQYPYMDPCHLGRSNWRSEPDAFEACRVH